MKHPFEVSFVETSESLRWIVLEDAWSLRKDFRWKWMAKLALWLIRKIGVNAREPSVEVKRVLIDPPKVMQKLFEQKRAMFDMGHEPQRVLIGAEDFAELMHTPEIRNYFDFDAEYMKSGRAGGVVIGLKIQVIPWMRGCLVMP